MKSKDKRSAQETVDRLFRNKGTMETGFIRAVLFEVSCGKCPERARVRAEGDVLATIRSLGWSRQIVERLEGRYRTNSKRWVCAGCSRGNKP